MSKNSVFGAVAVGALVLLGQQAQAQLAAPVTANYGKFYVGASAGVIIPQDIHVTISGFDNGSFDQSFSAGTAISGYVGYHVTPQIAVEGELGYGTADADSANGAINGFGFSQPTSGHIHALTLLTNALWTPQFRPGISPYIGGGIGFASTDLSIESAGLSASGSQTDFAANFIVGIDFAVGDRFTVGGRYRFLWVNSGRSSFDGFDTVTSDNFTAHVLTVNGTYRF